MTNPVRPRSRRRPTSSGTPERLTVVGSVSPGGRSIATPARRAMSWRSVSRATPAARTVRRVPRTSTRGGAGPVAGGPAAGTAGPRRRTAAPRIAAMRVTARRAAASRLLEELVDGRDDPAQERQQALVLRRVGIGERQAGELAALVLERGEV